MIIKFYLSGSSFELWFNFDEHGKLSSVCWFFFSCDILCLGQLEPTTDNKTGKNRSEFKTPSTINIRIDLKKVWNIYDLLKPSKHIPITVEIAELKIGSPTRVHSDREYNKCT